MNSIRAAVAVIMVGAGCSVACAQRDDYGREVAFTAKTAEKTDAEKTILPVLERMAGANGLYLAVSAESGRMLRLLVETTGAKNVVEIGTSTGYSGLWICLGLKATGGKLTTFEVDPGRAAQARKNFQEAEVGGIANVVEGDAHQNVRRLSEPIDLLFLDADKSGYPDYLARLLPLVRPGGLILADNVDHAPKYAQTLSESADLETVVHGDRLAITLKKR